MCSDITDMMQKRLRLSDARSSEVYDMSKPKLQAKVLSKLWYAAPVWLSKNILKKTKYLINVFVLKTLSFGESLQGGFGDRE